MTRAAAICPICGRPAAPPAPAGGRSPAPFCSTRCAEIDLGRWFTGQYRVPVRAEMEGEDAGERVEEEVDRSGIPG